MLRIRCLFDRAVTCAKVLHHVTNKEVRHHLSIISNCSRIAEKDVCSVKHLQIIIAAKRSLVNSSKWLAQYFDDHDCKEVAKTYWSDWSYWMGQVRISLKRLQAYGCNSEPYTKCKAATDRLPEASIVVTRQLVSGVETTLPRSQGGNG